MPEYSLPLGASTTMHSHAYMELAVQNIRGDVFWDMLLGITMYPFVVVQMHAETIKEADAKLPGSNL
jgi:hypothetical protein